MPFSYGIFILVLIAVSILGITSLGLLIAAIVLLRQKRDRKQQAHSSGTEIPPSITPPSTPGAEKSHLTVSDWVNYLSGEKFGLMGGILSVAAILIALVALVYLVRGKSLLEAVVSGGVVLAITGFVFIKVFVPLKRGLGRQERILKKIMSGELNNVESIRKAWLDAQKSEKASIIPDGSGHRKEEIMANDDLWKEEEEYKQLSEDWRNRDRMTWQTPSYLVVIAGALIITAFSELRDNLMIQKAILLIGLLFSWIFTIFLTRNMYLQGLGYRLLTNKDNLSIDRLSKLARRIPLHTESYNIGSALMEFIIPLSAVCLLLLCSFIIGVFFMLIWGLFGQWIWILLGFFASMVNVGAIVALSHLCINHAAHADDWRYKVSATVVVLIPIILIGFGGVIKMLDP